MAELWDDSALITAFNSAIAKYKTMHGKKVAETEDGSMSMVMETHVVENTEDQKKEIGIESSERENEVPLREPNDINACEEGTPLGNSSLEEAPAARYNCLEEAPTARYNCYGGSEYCTHQAPTATDENCYLCQWNAYYNQSGTWDQSAASYANGLQCQYCGFVNKYASQLPNASQTFPDASAFPEMVKAAVAEAVKATEGQKLTVASTGSVHSNFSDVAVAWFLAGFHTSRYLSSQGRESK